MDKNFKSFYEWCRTKNIPVIVLSSGMEPLIRALLKKALGDQEANDMQVICNQVKVEDNGEWHIVFHDDSHFGHDKSIAIKPYASLPKENRPKLFYCGDGVSDLSAAKETDLLFAKEGCDLVAYSLRENVDFTPFKDFSEIHRKIEAIVEGSLSLEQAVAEGRQHAQMLLNKK